MIGFIKRIARNYIAHQQNKIDFVNQSRLTNKNITLICSNCAGGILYHNLGLQFRSPFINLYMGNNDFLYALEHFDEFLAQDVVEDKNFEKNYPVGIGLGDVRIHFMHYDSFEEAIEKWNARKARVDMNNAEFMLTNFSGDFNVLQRFEKLPYANKVVFTREEYPEITSAFCLKGYAKYAARMENRGGYPIYGCLRAI